MATAQEIQAALDEAATALRAYYDEQRDWPGGDATNQQKEAFSDRWSRQSADTQDATQRALKFGATVRQLSAQSHVPGVLIINLIGDPQDRADAYAAELYHLERSIETVRQARTQDARSRYRQGERKAPLARSFQVTRVTLDTWLNDA